MFSSRYSNCLQKNDAISLSQLIVRGDKNIFPIINTFKTVYLIMVPSTPGSHGFDKMSESCHVSVSFSGQVVFKNIFTI
jgi:hypothetical protein